MTPQMNVKFQSREDAGAEVHAKITGGMLRPGRDQLALTRSALCRILYELHHHEGREG